MDVQRKRRWWLAVTIILLISYPLSLYPALILIEQEVVSYKMIKLYVPFVVAWQAVFPKVPTPTLLEPVASYLRVRKLLGEDGVDILIRSKW